jgi:hypothetical protein
MESQTPKLLIFALLAVMLEQETGVKPNNPEYLKLWEQFEEEARLFSLNAL